MERVNKPNESGIIEIDFDGNVKAYGKPIKIEE